MRRSIRRALCAVAGSLALASAAAAAGTPAPFVSLSPSDAVAFGAPSPEMSFGPPALAHLAVSNITTSVSLIPGLDLEAGDKVDLGGRLAPLDVSAPQGFDKLFLSSASAGMPYAGLAGGGDALGAAAVLSKTLRLGAGVQSTQSGLTDYAPDSYTALARLGGTPAPYAPRSADALVAGLSWDASKWANIGLEASQTNEHNAILGNAAPGSDASTTALGVSARVRFGGGWSTTASYSEGISDLDLRAGLAPITADSLHTRSYGIAIAKHGLFGDDTLGVALSRPALGAQGGFITMPGDDDASAAFFARNHLLDGLGASPETDVEIGYITTFLDGSLALQTNASFQMNYAGQTGANAVSLLSRARIKF